MLLGVNVNFWESMWIFPEFSHQSSVEFPLLWPALWRFLAVPGPITLGHVNGVPRRLPAMLQLCRVRRLTGRFLVVP